MNDLLHLTEGVRRGGPALHLTKLSVGQFCNIKLCWA